MEGLDKAAAWVGEVLALLSVHKQASDHGPAMSHIANAAYTRLREINEDFNPHKPSTHVPTAFDKEVPPRNVVEPPPPVERVPDGELKSETPVERRDL